MTYTAPTTIAGNQLVTSTLMNQEWADNITYLADTKPRAVAYRSTNLSIPNTTVTAVTFNAETLDNASVHSTVSNTERFTVPTTGMYLFNAWLHYASSATGERFAEIYVNGVVANITHTAASAVSDTGVNVSLLTYLSASDYVDVRAYQNSGGALNLLANYTRASICWMGV